MVSACEYVSNTNIWCTVHLVRRRVKWSWYDLITYRIGNTLQLYIVNCVVRCYLNENRFFSLSCDDFNFIIFVIITDVHRMILISAIVWISPDTFFNYNENILLQRLPISMKIDFSEIKANIVFVTNNTVCLHESNQNLYSSLNENTYTILAM